MQELRVNIPVAVNQPVPEFGHFYQCAGKIRRDAIIFSHYPERVGIVFRNAQAISCYDMVAQVMSIRWQV